MIVSLSVSLSVSLTICNKMFYPSSVSGQIDTYEPEDNETVKLNDDETKLRLEKEGAFLNVSE